MSVTAPPTLQLIPEWSPQSAVLLAWPHAETDWVPWLNEIETTYVELTAAISPAAIPVILCRDQAHQHHIESQLAAVAVSNAQLLIFPYDDTWCRDYGPLTLSDGHQLHFTDFRFKGWGGKYEASADDAIARHLAEQWQIPLQRFDFELEGGSIEADGVGTVLTTSACLLAANRRPDGSRSEVEAELAAGLGCRQVLWLESGGLIGDDTDSHIDNLARFCDPHTIAYLQCVDTNDPHFDGLQQMAAELAALKQTNGEPYRLVPIDMPAAQFDADGQRLPASYVNFLICNDRVIMPVFDCAEDAAAIAALQQAFPNHEIVTVTGQHLIKQFGGPHCATMQLPAGIVPLNEE